MHGDGYVGKTGSGSGHFGKEVFSLYYIHIYRIVSLLKIVL